MKKDGESVVIKMTTRKYKEMAGENIQQLLGQLDTYGKVIYTDGIRWILFQKENKSTDKKICFSYWQIGELFGGENNTKIRKEFEDECNAELKEKYNSFSDFWNVLDKESLIDEWYNLMSNLSKIEWKNKSSV